MSKENAERIIKLANQADSALHKTLLLAENILTEVEYCNYKETVANIMVAIQLDMLSDILKKYPNLDQFGCVKNVPMKPWKNPMGSGPVNSKPKDDNTD